MKGLGIFGLIALMFAPVTAWFTHVIFCLMHQEYVLLLAGALIAPVGVIHGVCIWFGFSWA